MPTLPTKSFATIVQNTVAGIQGRSSKLVNFSIGSTLRAIVEGFAGVFLWFEALALQLLSAIRLSTSSGADVDTFTADFMAAIPGSASVILPGGSPRLGAQAASGQVTFARFTAGPTSCFIPAALSVSAAGVITNAGVNQATTIQTADGSQTFIVVANTTYATYSATLGGYTIPSSIATLIAPVEALVPGAGGNVQAGAISVITSPITGVDTVINNANYTNGADQESDGSLKARFAAYILGLSRGDIYGLTSSIEGTAVTVQWTLTESYNLDGSWHPGYFFVVADDGSGSPSTAFLQAITDAANAVRPLGVQCAVFAPIVIEATVSMTITTAATYDHNTLVAQVAATVATNINSIGIGNDLPFSILASWAYAVPGVTKVAAVLLNGFSGDGASLHATRLTQDGTKSIGYATIKAASVIVN